MAIVFDMQINFLEKEYDLPNFCHLLNARVKPYNGIQFHKVGPTFITPEGPYLGQLSLCPKNVGFGVSSDDRSQPFHELNDDQMLDLSLHMYEFIKDLPDYQLALVGWELDGLARSYLSYEGDQLSDIAELEGLVVSNELLNQIKYSENWKPFDSLRHWIPCLSSLGNIFPDDDDD